MKHIVKLLLIIFLSSLVISCDKKNKESTAVISGLERIKQKGYISVITSPDLPPFEYLIDDKTIGGIEIEMAAKIAEDLGVKLRLVSASFDSIIPNIQAGEYDLGVSGFSITKERATNVLFSMPHSIAGLKVVTLSDSNINSIDEIRNLKVAVQSGSTAENYCETRAMNMQAYTTSYEALASVVDGVTDVWIVDNLAGSYMVKEFNSKSDSVKQLKILDDLLTYEEFAFITSLNNDDLIIEINKSLRKLKDDGTIARIFVKYNTEYHKTKDYIL